ncbi:MAG: DUF2330 domain-containing protein [Dehalococcoidia bacterium]|nr:DUF2330 domain-containing protein [Dehalococcoidia bacterium]
MRRLLRVLLLVISFGLVTVPLAPVAMADRGMVPISDVSVYGPGQKAIISWDGKEEIMILSTDVRASGDSQILELLPLPSEPQIEKGDFASFEQVDKLIQKHSPGPQWDRSGKVKLTQGEGVEIVFHEKIGAHDITAVKAADSAELVQWAQGFLERVGIGHKVSSSKLESLVEDYIGRGIDYFVFDLIEVTSEPKSIEPIIYRFDTNSLYYPLKISTLAEGWTDINLFLLTPQPVDLHWLPQGNELPQGMEIGKFYVGNTTQPIQFEVTQEELASIGEDIAGLLGENAWLTAMSYHGDLSGLTKDLRIGGMSPAPKLAFDSYQGRCTSQQKSQAIIGVAGSKIVAYGMVVTSTPCHELEARLDIPPGFAYPPTINLDIIAQEKPDFCVECLGEVPFQAEIMGLAPGTYDVIIQYQNQAISQEKVFLPISSVFSPPSSIIPCVELPTKATLKLQASGGEFTIYVESESGTETLSLNAIVKAELKGDDAKLYTSYLQFNEVGGEAMVEVNDVAAIVEISPSCGMIIEDSQLFLDAGRLLLVGVMPDQVVSKLRAEPEYLELKYVDGKTVYEFRGISYQKLLGLVRVEIEVKAQVDAATGEIIGQQLPWWTIFCW